MKTYCVVLLSLLLFAGINDDLMAGEAGRAVVKAAARRVATKASVGRVAKGKAIDNVVSPKSTRHLSKRLMEVLRKDGKRDAKLVPQRLKRPKNVFRYTTANKAQLYKQKGIPSGTHFTVNSRPGRPLSPARAKERYGLPVMPSARVKVTMPKGSLVKRGKVIGGKPGYGEIKTYHRQLPPSAVKNIVSMRH